MSKAERHPQAGYGASFDPVADHHHDEAFQDADVVKDLASPVHGVQGITDESGTDRTRNNYGLKSREERAAEEAQQIRARQRVGAPAKDDKKVRNEVEKEKP